MTILQQISSLAGRIDAARNLVPAARRDAALGELVTAATALGSLDEAAAAKHIRAARLIFDA